jgi:hypothetical protein
MQNDPFLHTPPEEDVADPTSEDVVPDTQPPEMAPLLKSILLGYLKDAQFKDPKYTKRYTRSPSGFYLIPGTPKIDTSKHPRPALKHEYTTMEYNFCQIVVPNVPSVKHAVIQACHDTAYSGHRGFAATKELVAKDFYWHGLDQDVNDYVRTCLICQKVKSSTMKTPGKLQNLSIPKRRGSHYSIDQIVSLPRTQNGFDAVLVIIDRLTKYVHYIPCHTSDTTIALARLFFQRVLVHWGIPDDIVSDRDNRFSSGNFIQEVWKLFGVHQSPSTAYRPQSDGQTERMNRVFHEYIRAYIAETHTNWDTHLYTAQFAVNNSISAATGCTPAFLTFGFHPRSPHSAQISAALADSINIRAPNAHEFVKMMHDNLLVAQKCLKRAQDKMKTAYDKHKRDLFFKPGDMVLLRTTHITLSGKRKFLPKFLGPLRVIATVGVNAYRLELPIYWKIHNVFNVSLLKPFHERKLNTDPEPKIPEILDDFSVAVDSITGHRYVHTKPSSKRPTIMYKVHFADTTCENDTWEFLPNIPALYYPIVAKYHADTDSLPPFAAPSARSDLRPDHTHTDQE